MGLRLDRAPEPVAGGERLDGRHEPPVGQQRGHDPAGQVAQLGYRQARLALGVPDQPANLGLVGGPHLRAAELERERDEPGLCTVVQVALYPPQLTAWASTAWRRVRVSMSIRARSARRPRATSTRSCSAISE